MVLYLDPGGDAVPGIHGGSPHEEGELDMEAPYSEKAHGGGPQEGATEARCEGGPRWVCLFGTVRYRRVIPLVVRMTKMWEYTSITDPDRVSTVAVTNDEVWSWLDVVLKMGN
jgi:hypothetical protein